MKTYWEKEKRNRKIMIGILYSFILVCFVGMFVMITLVSKRTAKCYNLGGYMHDGVCLRGDIIKLDD